MKKANVQAGDKFNSWTVIEEVSKEERDCDERRVRAKCDCGYIDVVNLKNIRYGKSKQCVKCRLKLSNEVCTKKWEPIDAGDYYLIPLTKGKYAKIDKTDYHLVENFSWCYSTEYAMTATGNKRLMHRFINDTPADMCTDHINGDKLDNRRCNLRTISREEHLKHHAEYIRSFKKFKLTESDVVNILKMIDDGIKLIDIAKQYDISHSVISSIKNNKLWKSVDRENI